MPKVHYSQWTENPQYPGCQFMTSSHPNRQFKPISSPGIRVNVGPTWPVLPNDRGYKIWADHSSQVHHG